MSSRIKGQSTQILIVVNGVVQKTITAVKSFSFSYEMKPDSQGYIGETTDRKDSTFTGVKFDLDCHHESKDILALADVIVNKARGRAPGTRINIKTSFDYPDGDRARVIIPDVEFDTIPVNVGSRTDYVQTKFSGAASEARQL